MLLRCETRIKNSKARSSFSVYRSITMPTAVPMIVRVETAARSPSTSWA
jgi:hypothetical protein